jgi:hypothetical protein
MVLCLLGMLLTTITFDTVPVGGAGLPDGPYVALGDSYTSGPLVPNPIADAGPCERSDHDYPALVASARRVPVFRDVSCGGASTDAMWLAQLPGMAPQLDAVGPDARLVTLGVGANDINLMGIVSTCAALGLVDPLGSPCKDHYTVGGVDQNAVNIRETSAKVGRVLADIHRRAPRARVLVVGYPDIVPQAGTGCWPHVSIAPGDLPYVRSVERGLNAMLAGQAAKNGSSFVDTYSPSFGHDVCRDAGTRWVEWLELDSPAAPIHPNALAMVSDALEVLGALGR